MSADLVALDRVNTLAQEGVANTASVIERLSGEPVDASLNDIRISPRERLDRRLESGQYVGVHADFSGHVDGTAVITMESMDAAAIAIAIGADGELIERGLESMGSIAPEAFEPILTDTAGAAVELSQPMVVDTAKSRLIPESAKHDDWIVTFTCEFQLLDRGLVLEMVLVPDRTNGFTEESDRVDLVPTIDRLVGLGDLTSEGADQAADHVQLTTGLEANVSVDRIRFTPMGSMLETVARGPAVGTMFDLSAPSHGYVVLLFEEVSATRIADTIVPDGIGDTPTWAGLGQSAINELGTILTNGLLDDWSDIMGGTVSESMPNFVADDRFSLLTSLAADTGMSDSAGVTIEGTVSLAGSSFDCKVHALQAVDGFDHGIDELVTESSHG